MSNIAHFTKTLDTASKFFRVMAKSGLREDSLMLVMNDPKARRNLANYINSGCKISFPIEQVHTFNVSTDFVSIPGISVDPKLTKRYSNLHAIPFRSVKDLKPDSDLCNIMNDTNIIKFIGGHEYVKTRAVCLSQIWQLLQLQLNGLEGVLLTNGYANIFYCVDKNNELFVVYVTWVYARKEWTVKQNYLDQGGMWSAGNKIFINHQS